MSVDGHSVMKTGGHYTAATAEAARLVRVAEEEEKTAQLAAAEEETKNRRRQRK